MKFQSYEHKRDALIVIAEEYANKACNDNRNCRKKESRAERWNRFFHAKMNELVKEAGI